MTPDEFVAKCEAVYAESHDYYERVVLTGETFGASAVIEIRLQRGTLYKGEALRVAEDLGDVIVRAINAHQGVRWETFTASQPHYAPQSQEPT